MWVVDEFITAAEDARLAVVAVAVVLGWPSTRGLTVPAIAEQLGVSTSTIARACARFREMPPAAMFEFVGNSAGSNGDKAADGCPLGEMAHLLKPYMLTVYFDTNVYDAIYKGRVDSRDVEATRALFKHGLLKGHLGIPALEELLGEWASRPGAVIQKLQIAFGLVGFDSVLNAGDVLLRQAVESYAGRETPSVYLAPDIQRKSTRALEGVIRGERSMMPFISQVVAEGQRLKKEAVDQWREAVREVRSQLSKATVARGHPERKDISWFLRSEENTYAEGLADYLGVGDACRTRGIEGLLKLRPVRFYVNALVAYAFDITIGPELDPRLPRRGDDYDFWQIISASTAEAFVTYDKRLASLMNRLPIDGFRVFPTISALLDSIATLAPSA